MRLVGAIAVAALCAAPVRAQDEAQLKSFFEGRRVSVMIDMPANEAGIDLRFHQPNPLNLQENAQRIRMYGVALEEGESAVVTRVKVKKDLIEFQLGGGGADSPHDRVHSGTVSKSEREKSLERQLKTERDPGRRDDIEDEIDDLRRHRERENDRRRERDRIANLEDRELQAQQALRLGSRFNLRFEPRLPPEALTPAGVMGALAEFVDFGGLPGAPPVRRPSSTREDAPREGGPAQLRKGMSREDVEKLLGGPRTQAERMEGSLRTVQATYEDGESVVEATFVDGLLVKYTIASR